MRKILSLFNPIFEFPAFLFPFVLILYLILFLLENLFSGFVSNNIDLNFFLIPVIIFGFLAVFSNKKELDDKKEKKPAKWDFFIVIGLSLLSFAVLIYKTRDLGIEGFIISIISALLVGFVAVILLFFPKEEEEEIMEIPKKEFDIPKFDRKKHNYTKLLLSIRGFSLVGLIIIIIVSGFVFSFYKGKGIEEKKITIDTKEEVGSIIKNPIVEIPDEKLLKETAVFVQNGSEVSGKAAFIATFLRDFNFGNVKTGDADNSNYKNAYVKFNKKDSKVASYIMYLLSENEKYTIVNMFPLSNASQSGIILILGQ